MTPHQQNLCLSINGIDNAFEASGLLRLFLPEEPVLLPLPGMWNGQLPAVCASFGTVVRIEAVETAEWFEACVCVFRSGQAAGHGVLGFSLHEAEGPAALLTGSRKLCAGTALYRALAQAFAVSLPWGSLTGVRPAKLAACLLDAGMPEPAARGMLTERTGMSAEKADLLLTVAARERPFRTPPADSVSLYVGIPFCATRCLYCSFTAYPVQRHGQWIPAYLDALGRELDFVGEWMARHGKRFSAVYIGGGTPTALSGEDLARLFDRMERALPMETALEFTVEAGRPDTVDAGKLAAIRRAGATRISINPQSMHAATLRRIGRAHTPEQVETAFGLARDAGFTNINADLIAGLPGETPDDFQETLARMAPLCPDSLTVHTMAVKRASRLHESIVQGQAEPRTSDTDVATMVAEAARFAQARGLLPYYLYRQKHILANLENTGYARPGAECRYNIETMSERQTILAAGSGAITKVSHGGDDMERTENVRDLSHYIGRIDEMIGRKRAVLARHYPDGPDGPMDAGR